MSAGKKLTSGATERESDVRSLMFPYEFVYLWHLARLEGYATARELADRYGSVKDWRRGDGRAAGNTLRALRRRGLVDYGDGIWELTPKGWLVVEGRPRLALPLPGLALSAEARADG